MRSRGLRAHATVVHGCAMRHTAEERPTRRPDHAKLTHEWSPRDASQRRRPRTGPCGGYSVATGLPGDVLPPRRLGNALEQRLRLAFTDPPPGAPWEAPAPLHVARATASPLPYTPSRGLCGSLPLLHGGGYAAPAGSCGGSVALPWASSQHGFGPPLSRCSLSSLLGRLCNVLLPGSCVKARCRPQKFHPYDSGRRPSYLRQ